MASKFQPQHRESCYYCGRTLRRGGWLGSDYPVVDHVEPLSRGGEDAQDNIILCCNGCNLSKRSSFLLEWVWSGRYFWRQNDYAKDLARYYTTGRWPRYFDEDDIREIRRRAIEIPAA